MNSDLNKLKVPNPAGIPIEGRPDNARTRAEDHKADMEQAEMVAQSPQDDAADREWEARARARDEWGGHRKTSRDNNAFDDGWKAALAYARAQARAEVGEDVVREWFEARYQEQYDLEKYPTGHYKFFNTANAYHLYLAGVRAGAGEGQKP